MHKDLWTSVDRYLTDQLVPADPALDAALATSASAGLPDIAVSPNHGKLLHLIAKIQGARKILEIGTLGGYSTIWLARALPARRQSHHARVRSQACRCRARQHRERGSGRVVQVRVGAALDTLPQLATEGRGPFDLVFIDADKVNTPLYFTWALTLSRPGSLIIVDNVVRDGAVADPATSDVSVQGMRHFFDLVRAEPRVEATAVQTVGIKGYDGLAMVRVRDGAQ